MSAETDMPEPGNSAPAGEAPSRFILFLEGDAYTEALRELTLWTHHVLLPVYGREATSSAPWCSRWWLHPEAVMSLHGLFLAWQELTGPEAGRTGPASWHRDFLGPVMDALRDPAGPLAGCKPGRHRDRDQPPVEITDPFGPLPEQVGPFPEHAGPLPEPVGPLPEHPE